MTDNALLATIKRLVLQNDILSKELASLKVAHRELKRKHNNMTIWKIIRRKHI